MQLSNASEPKPLLRAHAASALLHLAILGTFFIPVASELGEPMTKPDMNVTHIYVAPAGAAPIPEAAGPLLRSETFPPAGAGAQLDLTGVQLVIRDDNHGAWIEVLKRQEGHIGFANAGEPRYVTQLFAAPDWKAVAPASPVPLDNFFALAIVRPSRWHLVQQLRAAGALPPADPAFALFPPGFRIQVDGEIRRAAAQHASRGRISEAVIAFSPKARAGIVVIRARLHPGVEASVLP